MTEPVAWASKPDEVTGHSYLKLGSENPNPQIYTIPLYTAVQLPVEGE